MKWNLIQLMLMQNDIAKSVAQQLDDVQGALDDVIGLQEAIEETAKVNTFHYFKFWTWIFQNWFWIQNQADILKDESLTDGAVGGSDKELGLQGMVDAPILKMVPQEAQILTSYVANKALFWLVTDVLEIAAGVSLKWDPGWKWYHSKVLSWFALQ